ncbi:tyrosine-type recombinase/integrase [Clostridium frigoris]|uniref:Tyrosine-type recombinase/integrase n=1 Tax=Clostridium frigoris TaxID=205327 RepID=A0ABS6BYG9_9CLOT|nr:tyrosine-type recombinase/integrase [Clostridium frigoris]MBU3161670.1 tyrosine-type recombinase/integrase [Clostridium frigoris]
MLFKSALSEEFNKYLQIRASAGKYIKHAKYILLNLDTFLHQFNSLEKELSEETLISWCKTFTCKSSTKKRKVLVIRDFAKYLSSLGYTAFIPEIPRASSDYVPYIFSEKEWLRIIDACDNLSCGNTCSNTPIEFPLLVRMLYGCGLRLNEALSLQMKDINLDDGILIIRQAKRNRQRLVPMSKSLTIICRKYCQRMLCLVHNEYSFVFFNYYNNHYSISWAERWFRIILEQAAIVYERSDKHDRGPCLHCLRHTFTFSSFAKAEIDGCTLDDSVPFLSTYLGHENITETDKYLKFSYELYPYAHKRISQYTVNVFPDVTEE